MSADRRDFLKTIALAQAAAAPAQVGAPPPAATPSVGYPRVFRGRQLSMLAFPLGGIAAGSISLGGRGQLRDWEIFNRSDKGNAPGYAFASIRAQRGTATPVSRVLEARVLPPYEGSSGLGSKNAPGLPRLEDAVFTGEYPLARIQFRDRRLPVKVTLEAFSPFFPLDADDAGLPVAVLRYRVANPGTQPARVSIAFAQENPVTGGPGKDQRSNEWKKGDGLEGLFMRNPALEPEDPMQGSFVLAAVKPQGRLTVLRGWPRAKWWAGPMLFWDDFTADGALGPEAGEMGPVGTLCVEQEIAPGKEATVTFLLAWHFPNRTPERCGWRAPQGAEKTVIGNWYCTRFADAWAAAEYTAQHLEDLETRTRRFAQAVRDTTLPAAVKEAAMANLSTLATQTCFRTADGEFHGFEGVNDQRGCCYGNCTHVWNYETATAHLFPSFAQSLRQSAFGYSMDSEGAMFFRQVLPDGKERSVVAAADGQMGQIMKVYLDWRLSGDTVWLREIWPRVRRALEFAWKPGSWDADRDGVLEGVQHNTYDVEFYGPNPQCGIYYLGALRAGEEMARQAGDTATAERCRQLFDQGSRWIDEHLFNGEYYVQQVRGMPKERIHKATLSTFGSENTETPEFQVGEGCLVDQLVGQYQAEVAGLGPLLKTANIRKALESIYRYNYKRELYEHESVQRIFALNDESALVICDYGKGKRPRIPFSYYAEVMTGFEYTAATHMMYAGMIREGVECVENIRKRYDGERRNPWDEAECGHHYARAMAAWTGILALSGFRYHGGEKRVEVFPRWPSPRFRSFWSTASAWGIFSRTARRCSLLVTEGKLEVRELAFSGGGAGAVSTRLAGRVVDHEVHREAGRVTVRFAEPVPVGAGEELAVWS